MPNGLTGRNFVIAISLVVIVGTIIGIQSDAVWLGCACTVAGVSYLITIYREAGEILEHKTSRLMSGKHHGR
jgi:hypothetical protein